MQRCELGNPESHLRLCTPPSRMQRLTDTAAAAHLESAPTPLKALVSTCFVDSTPKVLSGQYFTVFAGPCCSSCTSPICFRDPSFRKMAKSPKKLASPKDGSNERRNRPPFLWLMHSFVGYQPNTKGFGGCGKQQWVVLRLPVTPFRVDLKGSQKGHHHSEEPEASFSHHGGCE